MALILVCVLAFAGYLALAVHLDHVRGITVAEDLASWDL